MVCDDRCQRGFDDVGKATVGLRAIDFMEQKTMDLGYVNRCVGAKRLMQGTRIDDDIQRVPITYSKQPEAIETDMQQ